MSMSDCEKCWDSICCCGWDYRKWSLSRLKEQSKLLKKIVRWREKKPNAKFSSFSEPETKDDNDFMVVIGSRKKEVKE